MAEGSPVKQVSDNEFENDILKSDKPAMVDFWAPWCGPCRVIAPIMEELAPQYDGKAVIAKINVDDNPETAQRFQVTSIPTLLMFKDGRVVDRAVGALPKAELQKFIDRNL
jgi:thioredoxin 1